MVEKKKKKYIYIIYIFYLIGSDYIRLSPIYMEVVDISRCLSGATAPSNKNPQVWSPDSSEELHQIVRECQIVVVFQEACGTFMTFWTPQQNTMEHIQKMKTFWVLALQKYRFYMMVLKKP